MTLAQGGSRRSESETVLLQRLREVPTSAVVDAYIRGGVTPPERIIMRGLAPILGLRSRAVGFARTQQLVTVRDRSQATVVSDRTRHFELVDHAGADDFLVIAVASDDRAASFGDILALQASARGAVGVALDGFTRDVGSIDEAGLPMWCRGTAMIPAGYAAFSVASTNAPVICGGVEVRAGDVIVADGDGVVVLRADEAEDICTVCEEMERAEHEARAGVRRGAPLSDLYPSRGYYQGTGND